MGGRVRNGLCVYEGAVAFEVGCQCVGNAMVCALDCCAGRRLRAESGGPLVPFVGRKGLIAEDECDRYLALCPSCLSTVASSFMSENDTR